MSESQRPPGTCILVPITAANAALCDEILKLHRNAVVNSGTSADLPHFVAATGELTFRCELIREYTKRAENCLTVLTDFEESGWPPCILDPLPGGKNAERLNNTVRSLNNGIHSIRFHAGGDAKSIRWKTLN
jgi:hypothetical protein